MPRKNAGIKSTADVEGLVFVASRSFPIVTGGKEKDEGKYKNPYKTESLNLRSHPHYVFNILCKVKVRAFRKFWCSDEEGSRNEVHISEEKVNRWRRVI